MDKANYTDNGKGRYPLSTDGLEFIQQQIELIYNVAQLYGPNYILKPSTTMIEGVIVVDGEMMPLEGSPLDYIQVKEEYDKLEADGLVFENARVRRVAQYVASSTGEGCYEASQFPTITTIEAMRPHLTPKGAIVMWSGRINDIPEGWELCDGKNNTPDLRGRFIVGYNPNDDDYKKIGNDGGKGKKEVALEAWQCALPEHTHNVTVSACVDNDLSAPGASRVDGNNLGRFRKKDVTYSTTSASTKAAAHENRPPYYVLAYIMKIV